MVISHKYKYLFIELPHTASTAIGAELCENYDGLKILRKHSTYYEFQRTASAEEKRYFVFSGIRNPLDEAVSNYYKFKVNHKERYSDPRKKEKGIVTDDEVELYNLIQATNADFYAFLKKDYRPPYDNWSCLSHKRFDFVIRFEHLQEDFSEVLRLIGIEQKRPLPVKNKAGGRSGDFALYYTPEMYEDARRIFGPFMKKWGYEFPTEWGDVSVSRLHQIQFYVLGVCRNLYWGYLKWSPYDYIHSFGESLKKIIS